MTTVKEMLKTITSERILNDNTQCFPEAASPGDVFRQGDIYIQLLDAILPEYEVNLNPNAQLAPGTTRGSRHILDSFEGVKFYTHKNPTALQGPIIDTTKTRVISHPEHGDCRIGPGIYSITYQRAFAEELRRQQD